MDKTLVIIFKPDLNSNELKVDSVAIGDFNDKEITISTGFYEGFSVTDFNKMVFLDETNPFVMSKDNEKSKSYRIEFINHYDDKSELVFVFDKKYIEEYSKKYKMSFEDTCLLLSKMAMNSRICFDENYSKLDKERLYNYRILPHKSEIDDDTILGMLNYTINYSIKEPVKEEKEDLNELAMKTIDEIRQKIIGQDEAIITLVTNIIYNQSLIHELCDEFYFDPVELDSRKVGILLDGTTGTGKTAILKMISSRFDLPIVIVNANSFSETGYVGPSITDILRKLYFISGKQIEKAQRGIVVLDEIDKLATKNSSDGKDMKKGVQEELLGFIGGGEYDVPLEDNKYGSGTFQFDTSKLTFILSGAFTNLRERKIKEQENKNKQIGFAPANSTNIDRTYTITSQDYVDEGLNREFFGRIKVLTCTKTYNFDDLKNIILYSSISPLRNIERTVQMYGYLGITYSEDFINEVCTQALEMQTGARALQTIMSGIQNRLLLGLFNHTYDFYEPIELTTDLLHEYNKTLIRRY